MRRLALVVLAAALLAACSADDDTGATGTSATSPPPTAPAPTTTPDDTDGSVATTSTTPDTVVADPLAGRPYEVFVPSTYDPATPMPLVVLLHGYGAGGDRQELYFQFEPLAEQRGFLYVHPDGTENAMGAPFWTATDACCGFFVSADDSGYLAALVDQVALDHNVDPARVYFVGHSNGGFMSYRMACDHAGTIAAIASLAGATFLDPADCSPSEPVSVLQIHGTDDSTILFDGGSWFGAEYPSAPVTAQTWAAYNGCGSMTTDGGNLDLDSTVDGDETAVAVFDGCPDGISVELWTIEGGGHVPARTPDLATGIIDFLFAHPKP